MIRSKKHLGPQQIGTTLLALAAMSSPLSAQAQEKAQSKAQEKSKTESQLPEVSVQASSASPYKAESASLSKLVKPLLETPQMVSVVKKELLQEQGAFNVMDALQNTPGITMQLGENGNTRAGDTFQMRGFAAQSSVFVDGVRDLGAVTRDTFNLEQVEIVKGPAGADVGRGAASGYVNLVSKLPSLEEMSSINLSLATAGGKRLSADLNRPIHTSSALRLNAFAQRGDVAGRDHVNNRSEGIAPALAVGLGEKARAYFYFQHLRQNNRPDGGVPTVGLPGFYNANKALLSAPRVASRNYYGSLSDYEKVEANMVTAKFEYDLNPNLILRHITRYGQSSIDRILTGVNAITATGDRSAWTVARTRQGLDQDNEIVAHQTSLNGQWTTGEWKHSVAAGAELMLESQSNQNRVVTAGVVIPAANLYRPDASTVLPLPTKNGTGTDGKTKTTAVYLFDAIDLNPDWQVNAGLRYERYHTETLARSLSTAATHPSLPVGTVVNSQLDKQDSLLSWKLGGVYKLAKNGRLYGVMATSLTPPGSNNFSLSASTGNINGLRAEPQKTTNLELGTKWDLLNNGLALTAAVYRSDNSNEIVQLDTVTNAFAQFGKRRIQGVEVGAVGQINPDWQVTAGVATMHTEVLQGSTGNSAAGAASRWSPELTATLWSTYKLSPVWTIGGGWRYTSEQKRVVDPAAKLAEQNMPSIPSSWLANAVISYQAMPNLSLQLNVNNVTNKSTIANLNSSGARYLIATPRTLNLSANILF